MVWIFVPLKDSARLNIPQTRDLSASLLVVLYRNWIALQTSTLLEAICSVVAASVYVVSTY
jgi:hypothetical protein